MKVLLYFLAALCFAGAKPNDKNTIHKIAGKFTHYRIDCKIYDLDGNLVRKVPGWYCHFNENGETLVGDGKTLDKYDKSFRKVWSQPIAVNHQIAKSEINNDILTISNDYEKKGEETFRTDTLMVLSEAGLTLKSFSFKEYAKLHPGSPAWYNDWTKDKFSDKSFEHTHINAFKEIFNTKKSKKILTGYVAYCLKERNIYFLDPELKKITRVISSGGRSLHELHQISDTKLIYYQNQLDSDTIKLSSIGTFDLKTETFSTLYENKDPKFYSFACSSVQQLPGNKLFIFHSACRLKQTVHTGAVEYVDLNTYQHVLKPLPFPQGYAQHAFLIDGKSYFKNSPVGP